MLGLRVLQGEEEEEEFIGPVHVRCFVVATCRPVDLEFVARQSS